MRLRLVAALLIGGLIVLPLVLPTFAVSIATQVLIFAILAMSIDVLAGFAGRTSLGHGAIFGTATYVVLWWMAAPGSSLWLALPLAVLASTVLAALFGAIAIRVSGVYFLLLTLALGMVVWGVCLRWTGVTGGENGLRGAIRPREFADIRVFYEAILAVTAVLAFGLWRLVRSPFGLALRGIRDSESRMRALGFNVPLHLFVAFTASGFFAGSAGALYALFNEFASPSTVSLGQSVRGLLMAITGGVGTIFGSLVGAALIVTLENLVSIYTARWQTVMGLIFIALMLAAPDGIVSRIAWVARAGPQRR
ncbi:MAG: branched-chain amino acid ABC transporter permease [Acetobacteraceae bacterium]|nr:branched-chain amino acid ABC transporter permease [Acetobacteraceae bacterium]